MSKVIHELRREVWLAHPVSDVFAFFAQAENLERITPPSLGFSILSPRPVDVGQGALIDYRMRLHGIPFRWRTRISRWEPERLFVDEQLSGPYRSWVHTHRFEARDGGTDMLDVVQYSLPLSPLGDIVHPWVRRELAAIFDYRSEAMLDFFPPR